MIKNIINLLGPKGPSKFILDVSCGNRMFWFQKNQENTIYLDNRLEDKGFIKERPNIEIKPDIVMDFTNLGLKKKFKLIVWDPPHCKRYQSLGVITKKYGCLNPENWRKIIHEGFINIWNLLEDYGILIFKWNSEEIKTSDILKLFPEKPLFGHPTNSKNKTKWFCFMKLPKNVLRGPL